MKRKLLLLIITFFAAITTQAQSSDDNLVKVKKLIDRYMYDNMGDYDSYNPLSFSEIKDMILPISEDNLYQEMQVDLAKQKKQVLNDINLLIRIYISDDVQLECYTDVEQLYKAIEGGERINKDVEDVITKCYNDISIKENKFDEYIKNYVGVKIGYCIKHKYRAKNKFGGIELYEYTFGFNENLSQVISVQKQ